MRLCTLVACAALLLVPGLVRVGGASAHDLVLVVHSYNAEYVWTQQINLGLQEGLRGLDVRFEYLYLDAKRQPEPKRLRQAGQEAAERIEATRPRLVVAADDAAQEYLVAPYLKGRSEPQVIFCGVNAPLSRYGFPAPNVSGVRERWHYRDGFRLLKAAAPATKSAAFLVEDSESGRYVRDDLLEEMRSGPMAVKVASVETVRTYQQWQRRVKALCGRVDALAVGLYHSLLDEPSGAVVPAEQVAAWTAKACAKPSLGFSDATKDHGQLCGVLESGQEQGYLAGVMAREVLATGVEAGRLPTRRNNKGIVLLNLKTAEKLGLRLPYSLIESAGVVVQ